MKKIEVTASILINEDGLTELLEKYRTTAGKLDVENALKSLLTDGLNEVRLNLSGGLRRLELDTEITELVMWEKNRNEDARLLALSDREDN